MITLIPGATYLIELCSGEQRHWRYLGPDNRAVIWWSDQESQREFNEASLMYAWRIVAEEKLPTET